MKRRFATLVAVVLSVVMAPPCGAKRIPVQAGSPEDKAIQQIVNQTDVTKRVSLIQKFASDFASQPDMVTYAQQLYQETYLEAKDYDQSIEYGEKALAADPQDTDVLLKLVRAAREKPDPERTFRYAAQFTSLYSGLETAPKPPGMDDTAWKANVEQRREELEGDYKGLEYVLVDAIGHETRAQERLQMLDQFGKAYPKTQYATNIAQLYAYTYQQLGDNVKALAYAEKTLAANPEDVAMLLLVAGTLSEQGQDLPRATALATKALDLATKAQPPADAPREAWENSHHATLGLAHSILGFIYLRQNKNPQAISEFKTALPLVRNDPALLSTTLYRLGFTQAKNPKMLEEARVTLTECSNVPGPFQQPARDLVAKIDARLAVKQ